MSLPPPEVGLVISHWFLWRGEYEAGEDAGRKARPAVIVIAVARGEKDTRVAVAPITHSKPEPGRVGVELPPVVKRQLGLDAQASWVICDELNEFNWPGADIERIPANRWSYGRLPYPLANKIRIAAANALRCEI